MCIRDRTPVVGWLLAGAAVASVIAAFATMPQFANGGVVDGSSFFGDKILARVNSGEMILNKSQQSNLFNLLDEMCIRDRYNISGFLMLCRD